MSGSPEGIYEAGVVDPKLPVQNSTEAFWQSELSQYANHQSPWPSEVVDVAIIGSGISGTSIAQTILQHRPDASVTLLEARRLCSGATGRNGGHIKTASYGLWTQRKRCFGVAEATRWTAFEISHLQHFRDLVQDTGIDCDLVSTEGLDAYFDQNDFTNAVASLEDMRKHAPHLADYYTVYSNRNEISRFGLSSRCVGAIGAAAGSIWPYKLVTGIMSRLIGAGKINVQTDTAVLSIDEESNAEYALLTTSRGTIKARTVVHATNAWLGHLVPEIRPYISPVRGNVVRQIPDSTKLPALASDRKSYWLYYGKHDYDYLIRRSDGSMVVGRANKGRRATGKDDVTDISPVAHLRGFPADVFDNDLDAAGASSGVVQSTPTEVTHIWSGNLGFTQDGEPFTGRLPFPGRRRQWICGGYHGMGMIKAYRLAQMVALMMLGQPISDEYPTTGLVTENRLAALDSSLDIGKCVARL